MKTACMWYFLQITAMISLVPACSSKQPLKKSTPTRVVIEKEVYTPCKGVTIAYPVLNGLPDTTVQIAINTKLHELFLGAPDSFKNFHEEEDEECPSTYES